MLHQSTLTFFSPPSPHLSLSVRFWCPFTPLSVSLSLCSLDLSELAKAAKKKLQAVSIQDAGERAAKSFLSPFSTNKVLVLIFEPIHDLKQFVLLHYKNQFSAGKMAMV